MYKRQKLDSAIAAAHGRSGKAIRALLDLDALRGSEDPDKDIPAALSALQKDSGYMFDTEETPPPYACLLYTSRRAATVLYFRAGICTAAHDTDCRGGKP